ncbi:LPS-assembly protein LptD [Candidatus Babeliales bacterium]|nr:LPS-assembly protein LptD [Candidatus Babeliales bacterium]
MLAYISRYFHSKFFIYFFFFSFFLLKNTIFCSVRDLVGSVKIIKANSIKQKIVDLNRVILEGEVEVFIDNNMHIWADNIEIDKKKKILIAEKKGFGAVIIESKDFLILADRFFFNMESRTGSADNMRIHFAEGYIRAAKAEKLGENRWKMEDILYTPCDAPTPHWSIIASSAKLYNNYLIRISGVLFKFGKVPFFVIPSIILPIQKRSKSGFLIPRISFDDELGFGIREEYYWSIAPRCDSTIGIDWREKKGIAFLDEFRWARNAQSFTQINSQYALEKNAFVKKNNKILKGTDKRYWVEGKDFRDLNFIGQNKDLKSLLRMDFGTDKKIGYQFFDIGQSLDDTFFNSWIIRSNKKSDLINVMFDGCKTIRKKFLEFTPSQIREFSRIFPSKIKKTDKVDFFSQKREIDNKTAVWIVPHVEWNMIYKRFLDFLYYRHDIFLDNIFSRERELEKFYIQSELVKESEIIGLLKSGIFRFFYNFESGVCAKFKNHILNFHIEPNFQIRSNIKDKNILTDKNVLKGHFFGNGEYRLFVKTGAEWAFPEFFHKNKENEYFHYFQPILKWEFLPKFKQNHWYCSDKWDRVYPTNSIELWLRNNWYFGNLQTYLNLCQKYNFYDSSDFYPLERSPNQKNLCPLNIEFGIDCDVLNFFIKQEYNWKSFQLLESQINFYFSLNKFKIFCGTLYQHSKLQQKRELFSDIPHFILIGLSLPLSKNATISYNGQFYSERDTKFLPFERLRSLSHSIRVDYEGHCWGISLGFEEKRYRQFGNWKSEQAITLLVKLESLGSVTKRFKRLPTRF